MNRGCVLSHLSVTMDSPEDLKRFWNPKQSKQERIFYVCLFVLCLGSMTYSLSNLTQFYLNDPVASQISVHYVNEMEFPEIGICFRWPLNISMLQQDGYTEGDISQLHWHFTQDVQAQIGLPKFWVNLGPSNSLQQNYSYDQIVEHYAAMQSDFFKQCSINYDQFDCKRGMKAVMHEKFGRCFKLNRVVGKISGAFAGFVIFMAVPKSVFGYRRLARLPQTEGVAIEIAHRYEPPRTQQSREQFLVGPNEETYIALQVMRLVRDSTPRRPCREGIMTEYSKAACRLHYTNVALLKYCNCSLLGFSDDRNEKVCEPRHLSSCTSIFDAQIHAENVANEEKYCVGPCRQIIYTKTITRQPLLADQIAWSLNETEGENYYFKFHIFYPNLFYTLVSELYVTNFDTILGDFGGIIGLYLGSSIIGIVALAYSCLSSFVRRARRKIFHDTHMVEASAPNRDTTETPTETPRSEH